MYDTLLDLFAEYLEKQDALSKLTEHEKLHEYGYSEIHTIAAIASLPEPNVTSIAQQMKMTKGAVSKIIKRFYPPRQSNPTSFRITNKRFFILSLKKGNFCVKSTKSVTSLAGKRQAVFKQIFPEPADIPV